MTLPTFTMRQLLEAGVHFGHHTRRWNPKMKEFIFGHRNNIHIIDLEKTVPLLYNALEFLYNITKNNGYVLFVGTKRSASEIVATSAKNCGQFYVNHRWLGGMLTNWETVSKSIKTLKDLENKFVSEDSNSLTKKEKLNIERSKDKLELTLGGIKEMSNIPDALFIIDVNKEAIAVAEANKLNIPVVAICDTNTDPSNIDFPIPGNDDAVRAVSLYCDLVGASILSGMEVNLTDSGVDLGSLEKNLDENLDVITDEDDQKETDTKKTEKSKIKEDLNKSNLSVEEKPISQQKINENSNDNTLIDKSNNIENKPNEEDGKI